MPKKKNPIKSSKPKKKTEKNTEEMEPSWEFIGRMVGKKVESEKGKWGCCPPWWKPQAKERGGNFFGALLFGIILVVVLNSQEIIFHQVSWWLEALMIFGWALMWS